MPRNLNLGPTSAFRLQQTFPEIFSRTMEEELGMVIEATNPDRLVGMLHEWRRSQDGAYDDIVICLSSRENEVILVKKSVELT